MERGSLIGLVGAFVLLIGGMFLAAGGLLVYWDLTSVFVTVGGSICATMVAHPWDRFTKIPSLMRKATRPFTVDILSMKETLITFAEKARREGVLSLEDDVADIPDVYLKKAIQLVVDGTDPEIVKGIMFNEIYQMQKRHEQFQKIFADLGVYAPAFGMIGTLTGLVAMLQNLSDTASIGTGMAVALITTLYGAIMANVIAIPMEARLAIYSNTEAMLKEIILEGVLSIQAGDNPAILREKLNSFLATSDATSETPEE